jgi:hypothetical protein
MQEKTRLYNAMQRGEYLDRATTYDDRGGLVDFDRKWADKQHSPTHHPTSSDSTDSDAEDNDDPSSATPAALEPATWLDAFGRLRHGTARDKAIAERDLAIAASAQASLADAAAHPSAPTTLLHGDVIQSAAFNPDAATEARMAALAAKRDRSATPPPDTHYDASAEIRRRGNGFFGFSTDKEEREREMAALATQRAETERVRASREEVREKRRAEVEERRRMVAEKRRGREVDAFLEGLDFDDGSSREEDKRERHADGAGEGHEWRTN